MNPFACNYCDINFAPKTPRKAVQALKQLEKHKKRCSLQNVQTHNVYSETDAKGRHYVVSEWRLQ